MFTHYTEDPNCEVRDKTNTTRAKCRITPKKRVDGIVPSTKVGNLISAEHKKLYAESESRCGHKNEKIVQDDFANWIQSYPMKNERYIGHHDVFTKISCSVTEAGKNLHRQAERVS